MGTNVFSLTFFLIIKQKHRTRNSRKPQDKKLENTELEYSSKPQDKKLENTELEKKLPQNKKLESTELETKETTELEIEKPQY